MDRLIKLPITVEHITTTGIGLTLNGLRKCVGEVGSAASTLITKWKTIVAEEVIEDGSDEQPQRDNVKPKSSDKVSKDSVFNQSKNQPDYENKHKTEKPIYRKSVDCDSYRTEDKKIEGLPNTSKQPKPLKEIKPSTSKHSRVDENLETQELNRKDNRPLKKRKISSTAEIVIDSSMGASFADALGIVTRPSVLKKKPQLLAKLSKTFSKSKSEKKDKSSNSNGSKEKKAPLLLRKRDDLEPVIKKLPSTLDETITYNSKSKKERTKVFSGNKVYRHDEVPKLYDICIRWLQEHIDGELLFTS